MPTSDNFKPPRTNAYDQPKEKKCDHKMQRRFIIHVRIEKKQKKKARTNIQKEMEITVEPMSNCITVALVL